MLGAPWLLVELQVTCFILNQVIALHSNYQLFSFLFCYIVFELKLLFSFLL